MCTRIHIREIKVDKIPFDTERIWNLIFSGRTYIFLLRDIFNFICYISNAA